MEVEGWEGGEGFVLAPGEEERCGPVELEIDITLPHLPFAPFLDCRARIGGE